MPGPGRSRREVYGSSTRLEYRDSDPVHGSGAQYTGSSTRGPVHGAQYTGPSTRGPVHGAQYTGPSTRDPVLGLGPCHGTLPAQGGNLRGSFRASRRRHAAQLAAAAGSPGLAPAIVLGPARMPPFVGSFSIAIAELCCGAASSLALTRRRRRRRRICMRSRMPVRSSPSRPPACRFSSRGHGRPYIRRHGVRLYKCAAESYAIQRTADK
jgi:hypothetical protein